MVINCKHLKSGNRAVQVWNNLKSGNWPYFQSMPSKSYQIIEQFGIDLPHVQQVSSKLPRAPSRADPTSTPQAFDVCLFTGYYGVKMAAQLGFVLVYQVGFAATAQQRSGSRAEELWPLKRWWMPKSNIEKKNNINWLKKICVYSNSTNTRTLTNHHFLMTIQFQVICCDVPPVICWSIGG